MNLKEKLQELAQERQKLQITMIEITGAMKILYQQILESEPELNQPLDTEASKQPKETGSSKTEA